MSNFIQNSFQTPNAYVDQFMYLLSGSEYKVLCYLVRRIFGFQKRQDRISIRQIARGIQNREREFLDHGTGLSNASAVSALQNLILFKLVRKVAENNWANEGAMYELQLDSSSVDYEGLLQRADLLLNSAKRRTEAARLKRNPGVLSSRTPGKTKDPFCPTEGGCSVEHKGGALLHRMGVLCPTETQNKDRNTSETKKEIQSGAYRETKISNITSSALSQSHTVPEITLFCEVTGRYPIKDQIPIIIERWKDRDLDPEELKPYWLEWVSRDHKRTSLGWLDWVDKRQIPSPGGKTFISIKPAQRTPSADFDQVQTASNSIDPRARELWNEILGKSREDPSISRVDFETWVNSAIPARLENNCLYISSANQIGCNWLQKNFTLIALKYIEQSAGDKFDICFQVGLVERA